MTLDTTTRRPFRASAAVWALVTLIGWLTRSTAVVAFAPLLLVLGFGLETRRAGKIDLFEPIWMLAALFAFEYLIVPACIESNGRAFNFNPGYLDNPASQFQLACVIGGLGFVALLAGYRSQLLDGFTRPRAWLGGSPSSRFMLGFAAALLGLGTLAVAAGVRQAGVSLSPSTLFSAATRDAVVGSYSGHGYLTIGFTLLMLGPPVLALWASMVRTRGAWIAAGLAAIVAIGELGGIVGTRIGVLAVILGVCTVIHYRARRFPLRAVIGLFALAVAFGVVQSVLRGTGSHAGILSPAATISGTLDGFYDFVNALARVHRFQLGKTILQDVVVTYIPRALWAAKPVIYGAVKAQEIVMPGLHADVGGHSTYPIGIVAEGYVNFAVFGAVGIPLLTGALARGLGRLLNPASSDWGLLVVAWSLPNLVSVMRGVGGGVLQIAVGAVILAPVAVASHPAAGGWRLRLRPRARPAAGP
jgi:hypothetical protein